MIRDQVIAQVTSDDFVSDMLQDRPCNFNVGIYVWPDGDVMQKWETVGTYLVDRWTGARIAKLASCGCITKCDWDPNYDVTESYPYIKDMLETDVADIPYGYFADEEK